MWIRTCNILATTLLPPNAVVNYMMSNVTVIGGTEITWPQAIVHHTIEYIWRMYLFWNNGLGCNTNVPVSLYWKKGILPLWWPKTETKTSFSALPIVQVSYMDDSEYTWTMSIHLCNPKYFHWCAREGVYY